MILSMVAIVLVSSEKLRETFLRVAISKLGMSLRSAETLACAWLQLPGPHSSPGAPAASLAVALEPAAADLLDVWNGSSSQGGPQQGSVELCCWK